MKKAISGLFVIALVGLFISQATPLFAHEGEQHAAPDVAAIPVPGADLLVLYGTTENFEVVIKYPRIRPKKKASLLVYLSDYATNAPVTNAEINVTVPGVVETPIKVEPTRTAGVYSFDLILSQNGRYDLLFDISGERLDLIPIPGLEVVTISFWKEFRFPFWSLKYLIPLLVLGFLVFRFREKLKPLFVQGRKWVSQRTGRKFLLVILVPLVTFSTNGEAHEGESHGDTEFATGEPSALAEKIPLSKESQFLLGVRTVLAEKKSLTKTIKALGKVVPRPQTSTEVFSMQEGIILPPEKGFPLPGQKVRKGDVLAIIQSIGSFSVQAPIAGTVTEILFTRGQHVEHDTKLLTIIDFSNLWIETSIYESDLPKVQNGQGALITSESYPDKRFEGKLINLSQVIDPATRATKAIFEVVNLGETLRVGMFVQVAVETGETMESVAIPAAAVIEKGDKKYVYVHTEPELFEGRVVSTMEKVGDFIVITEGLKEGDRVVTEGNYQLSTTVIQKPKKE